MKDLADEDRVGSIVVASRSAGQGASWVVDGGMLQMERQVGAHLADDSWRMI